MLKGLIISISAVILIFTCLGQDTIDNKTDDTAYITSCSKNGSHIEYPQIEGIKDPNLKQKINKLLQEEVIKGPKDASNQNFVDFSDPQSRYDYTSGVGFLNENIGSFWYSFTCYNQKYGPQGFIYRYFCITINMKTGTEIHLTDFMDVDDRLINSGVPNAPKPDYNGVGTPIFHTFKDAFEIYRSDSEKDPFHVFKPEWVLKELRDTRSESRWLIEKNKDISFYTGIDYNFVTIPFAEISGLIHPNYLKMLEE